MLFKLEIKVGDKPPRWEEFDIPAVEDSDQLRSFAQREISRRNWACENHLHQRGDYQWTGKWRIISGTGRNLHSWRITNPHMKGCSKYLYYEVRCSKCGMRAHRVGYIVHSYICQEANGHHHMSICPC